MKKLISLFSILLYLLTPTQGYSQLSTQSADLESSSSAQAQVEPFNAPIEEVSSSTSSSPVDPTPTPENGESDNNTSMDSETTRTAIIFIGLSVLILIAFMAGKLSAKQEKNLD